MKEKLFIKDFCKNKNFRIKKVNKSDEEKNDENSIVTSRTYLQKKMVSNRWNKNQTHYFYESLKCCNYDFSLINLIFVNRSRKNIRDKFKHELKKNRNEIEKILKEYKNFNSEEFEKLKKEVNS